MTGARGASSGFAPTGAASKPVGTTPQVVDTRANARARAARRRVLRRLGLKASELDGIAAGYLMAWARGQARLDLIEAGQLDEDFWRSYNSIGRQWRLFEQRLKELGIVQSRTTHQPGAALRAWAASRTGSES